MINDKKVINILPADLYFVTVVDGDVAVYMDASEKGKGVGTRICWNMWAGIVGRKFGQWLDVGHWELLL